MNGFRPDVVALEAYVMSEEPLPVKVNQNEAPWDWPPGLKEEAARRLASLAFNRYPPFREAALTRALEGRWDLPEGSILVGNGSNELLQALFTATLGPGRSLLMPAPSFGLYAQMAMLAGGRAVALPLTESMAYDPEAWIEAVRRERPEVVLLCSPNNPTGSVYPAEAMARLLEEAPGLVVADEAYAEFSSLPGARRFLPEARNLVVLRTFSKAWGGAGLRLGYLMAAPGTAAQVRKALLPYNLSSVTAALGLLALENAALFEERAALLGTERARLREGLARFAGLGVYPSEANFLLVRFPGGIAGGVFGALKARGILVRRLSGPRLEDCLRMSVGSPEENDALLAGLAEVLP